MIRFWRDRRRQLFVDSLQTHMILRGLTTVGIGVALCLVAVFGEPIAVLFDANAGELDRARAAEQFLTLHSRVWLGFLLVLLLTLFRLTVGTHRIAGPLYRLRTVLTDVQGGDLTVRARIRKKDYLHREADTLNATLEALDERVGGIAARSGELRRAIDNLRTGPPSPELVDESARLAAELETLIGELTTTPLSGPTGAARVRAAS